MTTYAELGLEYPKAGSLHAQEGPQLKALTCTADILFYGGEAGGGKTFLIELDPCQHVENKDFRGVIVRKSYPEIADQGGLWDESFNIYPHVGGSPAQQARKWTFPSGASLRMRNLENLDYKTEWKGMQIAYLGLDQVEDLEEECVFYLLSRVRSMSGIQGYVRASCNPRPGWLADFLEWWIDQSSGYPIAERDGVIRWMARSEDGQIKWYDTMEEGLADNPHELEIDPNWRPFSVTFIRARYTDNKMLLAKDPGYGSRLSMLSHLERARLRDGNWKISEHSIIDRTWIQHFSINDDGLLCWRNSKYPSDEFERTAVIDTAGTSKQREKEKRGKPASFSCAGIFDYHKTSDMLLWRDVLRDRLSWGELLRKIPQFLDEWSVVNVAIENAHYGPALAEELRAKGYRVRTMTTKLRGMETGRGASAKLERMVASKFLKRLEDGGMLFDPRNWKREYTGLMIAWTGLDDEVADLIDVGSYACVHALKRSSIAVA